MLILGHRGARASRHVPENTIASFELCLQHGCDGFEFDVRLSSNRQAVICHDPVAGGKILCETAAHDLGLPTLEEVLQKFATSAFLDIEIKVAGIEAQTIAALRAHSPRKGYVVSSFLPEVLRQLHALDPSVPLGLLCERKNQRASSDLPVTWMIPRFDLVDQTFVQNCRANGKKVMVWTVNDADQMRRMAGWGAEALISDNTELLVRTLRT